MPRDPVRILYVGIKNVVVALRQHDGTELWRTKLKGSDFVTVLHDGEALFAANSGEVFRLDPESGVLLWKNPLKGLGMGLVSLATQRASSGGAAEMTSLQKRQAAAAAAAAGGAAGAA